MAGIRAGFALGRPDLLAKLRPYGGGMLPVTGLACAAYDPTTRPSDFKSNPRLMGDVKFGKS